MNLTEKYKMFSAFLLISEFSKYTPDEIRFEMEMFNKFEKIIDECSENLDLSEQLTSTWWKRKFRSAHNNIEEFLLFLRLELACAKILVEKDCSAQKVTELGIFWTMQFTAMSYTYFFAEGYFQNKDTDKETAENCAYLAAYLGSFGLDPSTKDTVNGALFNSFVVEITQGKTGENTIHKTFRFMTQAMWDTSQKYNKNPPAGTEHITLLKDDRKRGLKRMLINSFFGYMVFGYESPPTENDSSSANSQLLWKSAGQIVTDSTKNVMQIPHSRGPGGEFGVGGPNETEPKLVILDVLRNIELLKIENYVANDELEDLKKGFTDKNSLLELKCFPEAVNFSLRFVSIVPADHGPPKIYYPNGSEVLIDPIHFKERFIEQQKDEESI